jgi:hypothetical protein
VNLDRHKVNLTPTTVKAIAAVFDAFCSAFVLLPRSIAFFNVFMTPAKRVFREETLMLAVSGF